MNKATIVVRKPPFNTLRNSEALRLGVGLTLREGKVQVVFVDDGVYLLRKTSSETIGSPDIKIYVETLETLGHGLVAEKESLEERGIGDAIYKVQVLPRDEIATILAESDTVISF